MYNKKDNLPTYLRRLHRRVSLLLRIFTAACLALMLIGLAFISYFPTGSSKSTVIPISHLLQELIVLNPAAILTLALYIVLSMPVLIIVLSLTHFFSNHDTKLTLICVILLLLLAASFFYILL